jgi:trk system potassium uptake protein TrkA
MRILILGAGNTGRNLAAKLCDMDHDVVVVDKSPDHLAAMSANLDVMTVHGSGSSPVVLEEAAISKADLLIAVTSSDEVNILACLYANAAGVSSKVARVTNAAFVQSTMLDFRELGVDLMVSQNEEVCREIHNMLRYPGVTESVDLFDGRLVIAGIRIGSGNPLLDASLSASVEDPMLAKVRFVAILRDEELILPRGDTHLEDGDDVYVALKPEDLPSMRDWMYPGRQPFEKIILAGGGGLGLNLAEAMEASKLPAVLLEHDAARADECSEALQQTVVFHGDASDRETLINAGVGANAAFVAVTGDEELNIISCMLARKLGAALTLALVRSASYVPIIRDLELLDHVLSPHQSMVNTILRFVRGKHVRAAAQLHWIPGELLHVSVREKHRWVGKAVQTLKMPGDCILASVLRDEQIHIPHGNLTIQEGDQLVIFCRLEHVERIQQAFKT